MIMTKYHALEAGISSLLLAGLFVMVGAFSNPNPALAQELPACQLPAGMARLAPPRVTAQQVEDGSASLTEFALAARERYMSLGQEIRTLEEAVYLQCRIREEGSPWRSGSTYLVFLTHGGRVSEHAKSMALAGRQLDRSIYGAILQALGIDQAALANPAAAFAAFAAAAAGNGGVFNVPGVPGASGYAAVSAANPQGPIMLAGFEIDESHLAEEKIDFGNPSITAAEVVDRRTLKAFVNEAIKHFLSVLEMNDPAALSKLRTALRDPNGPWRHGPVYLYALERTTNVIWFHGAFPDRFEYRPLVPTVRDVVTGEFVLEQVIEAAESSPEGGFVVYHFDNPNDPDDSADVPKIGYARQFDAPVRRADGSEFTLDIIVGSGIYLTSPEVVAASRSTVVESVLPQVMRAMTASTVDAISGRIRQAASGAPPAGEASLGGASTLSDAVLANRHALANGSFEPVRLLADSSFVLPLDAAGTGDGGLFRNLALWGSGDYRSLSGGSSRSVSYDGDVSSGSLGIDTRLGANLLAGLSVAHAQGSVDYTDTNALKGKLTSTLTSANPYVGWQAPGGMSLWTAAGYGTGEVEIEDANGTETGDLTQRMVAAGANGPLVSSDRLIEGGTARLTLKGEVAFTQAEIDGSGSLRSVSLSASRQRLLLEGSYTRALSSGATFTPSIEVGMRRDGGDGEAGNGVEIGGGLRYSDTATGLTVEGGARTLVGHSGDYEEWGLSGLVRIDPGATGRGLALSLQPSWGHPTSGVRQLWENGLPGRAASAHRAAGHLDAQVAYGMGAAPGLGVVTPYAGLGLAREGARSWLAGMRWQLAPDAGLSLEGTRREPARYHDPEHSLTVRGSLRW